MDAYAWEPTPQRIEQANVTAKILRRAIRAAAVGADPGDLSGAENPDALDLIRAAVST